MSEHVRGEVARTKTLHLARPRYDGAGSVLESARRSHQMYQQGAVERLLQLRDMAEAAYKAGAANVLVDANRWATEIDLGRVERTEALLHAAADALAMGCVRPLVVRIRSTVIAASLPISGLAQSTLPPR